MAKVALAQQQRKRKADDAIDVLAADNGRGRRLIHMHCHMHLQ